MRATPSTRRSAGLLLALLTGGCSSPYETPRDHGPPVDRPSTTEARLVDYPRPLVDRARPDLADLRPPDLKPCVDDGVTAAPGITVRATQLVAGGQATITYGAPAKLAASSNLSLHYAADFWSSAATDVAMTRRSDGVFEVTITLPADAHLLDFVFFTTSGSNKQWDNNNGADYHRSVGGPTLGPYLTFRDNLGGQPDRDPAQGLMVSFQSDHPCVGRVRYGTTTALSGGVVSDAAPAAMHHLVLSKLAADTVHYYRVECQSAGACASEPSPTYSFRTAPQNPVSFTFVQLSDAQDYRSAGDRWKDVAAMLTQPPHDDARFLLFLGDLIGGDEPIRWWDFFDKGRALLASKVIVPVIGNHDAASSTDTSSFDEHFELQSSSGTNTRYGLRYGAATFLLLNALTSQISGAADWRPGGAQYGWAQGVLSQPSPWRFAAWHIPPYNAGVRHSSQQDDVRPMTQLFNDSVDWVLSGHEHLYQRTLPIRFTGVVGGKVTSSVVGAHGGAGGGVGYLVSPAAGHDPAEDGLLAASSPERARLAYPTAALITNDTVPKWHGFVRVTLQGKTIQIQAFAVGESAPRDSLSYSKP